MNIYQKLVEVRKCVPYLQKENRGPQYQYVGSSQVLASVRAKMDELGLILEPEVIGHKVTTSEKTNMKGNLTTEYFTELDIEFTWVNAENPEEKIMKKWYGQGIDTAGEKGVGKALTYAEKYFLLKYFNIATDKDDPDSFQGDKPDNKPQQTQQQFPKTKDQHAEYATKLKQVKTLAHAQGVSTSESWEELCQAVAHKAANKLTIQDIDTLHKYLTEKQSA